MHFLKLAEKLPKFFSTKDVQSILSIQKDSARVLCARYTKKGIFLRLKRDLYVFKQVFLHLDHDDFFHLSSLIQTHTYISFTSALAYHGVLPGLPHYTEAVSFQRSMEKQVGHLTWKYHHLPKKLFFSYQKETNSTIATPEKALLDLLYLYSLGRYYIDLRRINLEALSFEKLLELSRRFPPRTQKLLSRLYTRSKKGLK
ncbi:MAG: hypothetical protein WC924_03510 [Candidatus Gracilibacteria bacterium]